MDCAIVWFRRDLRLADNPALHHALQACERIVPVFVDGPAGASRWEPGGATRWWLYHSLTALDEDLRLLGSRLLIRRGPPEQVLADLCREAGARQVFFNRLYEPAAAAAEQALERQLAQSGIAAVHFNASLLNEPWAVSRRDGSPYRVFSAYARTARQIGLERRTLARPGALPPLPSRLRGEPVGALGLLPATPWYRGLEAAWRPGETGALQRLHRFRDERLIGYADGRERPDVEGTSRLSAHLHFGELSIRVLVNEISRAAAIESVRGIEKSAQKFHQELLWREFAYHLLHHFPETPTRPLDRRFEDFPWATHYAGPLRAWQRGETGIPMVDAGMRELWQTGWMHNRVRMISASFLTKNLLIPWQEGARWYWDTLTDADLANNTLGWQWTAGCGADAAPFFRIFNPVLQGQRFDPDGRYVSRWIPCLERLPEKFRHQPWAAPAGVLDAAGLRLGQDYPRPIVELKHTRRAALAAFDRIKRRRR